MEQISPIERRESAPPAPPRWKGIQSLDLVRQFNRRCIDMVRDVAADSRNALLPLIAENRESWIDLSTDARDAIARLPFILVDAHFADEEWWRRESAISRQVSSAKKLDNGLPREFCEELMHETAMFAWQTARWNKVAAQISLGLTTPVTDIIAALTPQQIRAIATREHRAIRIRWSEDRNFWKDLLVAAGAADHARLATLILHAKLLFLSDLTRP